MVLPACRLLWITIWSPFKWIQILQIILHQSGTAKGVAFQLYYREEWIEVFDDGKKINDCMHKKFTELWHVINCRKSISMSYDNLLIYVVFKTGLYIMEDILGGIQATRPITNHRQFKYLLCLRFCKRHWNTNCSIIHNSYIITF